MDKHIKGKAFSFLFLSVFFSVSGIPLASAHNNSLLTVGTQVIMPIWTEQQSWEMHRDLTWKQLGSLLLPFPVIWPGTLFGSSVWVLCFLICRYKNTKRYSPNNQLQQKNSAPETLAKTESSFPFLLAPCPWNCYQTKKVSLDKGRRNVRKCQDIPAMVGKRTSRHPFLRLLETILLVGSICQPRPITRPSQGITAWQVAAKSAKQRLKLVFALFLTFMKGNDRPSENVFRKS